MNFNIVHNLYLKIAFMNILGFLYNIPECSPEWRTLACLAVQYGHCKESCLLLDIFSEFRGCVLNFLLLMAIAHSVINPI